jgi:hypothetical protein
MNRVRWLPTVATLAIAGASLAWLARMGPGLPAACLTSRAALAAWLRDHDAGSAALAVAWLAAVVASGYVLVIALLGGLARMIGWRPAIRWVDALTIPSVRRALAVVTTAGISAGLLTGSPAGATPLQTPGASTAAQDGDDDLLLVRLPDDTASPSVVTMHRLPDADPATNAASNPASTAAPTPDALRPPTTAPPPPPAADTWTIAPGDHLWEVAHDVLAESWGRAVTDREVAAYWEHLIAENRGVLVDPQNPDLVYAGQVFTLPDVPSAP